MMLLALLTCLIVCGIFIGCMLPKICWETIEQNCYRLDGTRSPRRVRREVSALSRLLATIAFPAIFSFLALFAASTFVFNSLIPGDMIVRSFEEFSIDPAKWRGNLSDVQREHAEFLQRKGASTGQVTEIQRFLWHNWLAVAGSLLIFVGGSVMFFFKTVNHAVKHLVKGIRKRRRMYARLDVTDMMAQSLDTEPARLTLPTA